MVAFSHKNILAVCEYHASSSKRSDQKHF